MMYMGVDAVLLGELLLAPNADRLYMNGADARVSERRKPYGS
jgi:hypothetical protein